MDARTDIFSLRVVLYVPEASRAATGGLMWMSMPWGKGALIKQLPPEQKKSPCALVVLNVNRTPLRVIVKFVAPEGAMLGSNGSSGAPAKMGSAASKISKAWLGHGKIKTHKRKPVRAFREGIRVRLRVDEGAESFLKGV